LGGFAEATIVILFTAMNNDALDDEIAELESKIDALRRELASKRALLPRADSGGQASTRTSTCVDPVDLVKFVDGIAVQMRSVFRRRATFGLFIVVLWSFLLRLEGAGVSSAVRCFGLAATQYHNLLGFFHSSAFSIRDLCQCWANIVVRRTRAGLLLNGKPIYLTDAIKTAKEGRKMPGVKVLHQESESNSKPEFIRGHFWGGLSVLIGNTTVPYALPLRLTLQDGIKLSPSVRDTLVDKMAAMIIATAPLTGVVVADAYYAARGFLVALTAAGFHVITRLRSNAVAYEPAQASTGKRGRGRPPKYGKKIHLSRLFRQRNLFRNTDLPLYGDIKNIAFLARDLLWRGLLVRTVLTIYPNGSRRILLATDLSLLPEAIIQTYGFRFTPSANMSETVAMVRIRVDSVRRGAPSWMKIMERAGQSVPEAFYGDRFKVVMPAVVRNPD
jgi:hypothetical protein